MANLLHEFRERGASLLRLACAVHLFHEYVMEVTMVSLGSMLSLWWMREGRIEPFFGRREDGFEQGWSKQQCKGDTQHCAILSEAKRLRRVTGWNIASMRRKQEDG